MEAPFSVKAKSKKFIFQFSFGFLTVNKESGSKLGKGSESTLPVFSLQPLPALAPPGDPALSHVLHKISDDSSRSPEPAAASVRLAAGKFANEHFARVVAAGAHTRQRVVGPLAHTDGTVGVAAGRQAPYWGKDDISKVPLTRIR